MRQSDVSAVVIPQDMAEHGGAEHCYTPAFVICSSGVALINTELESLELSGAPRSIPLTELISVQVALTCGQISPDVFSQ